MSLADELNKLEDLRARGVLSEAEFQRAKQHLLDGGSPPPPAGSVPVASALNSFRRSSRDKWIGGVCGGLAVLTGLDSWVWRLILTVLLLFGGTGFVLYLLLWIFVPAE